jgi:hypothetical protein
MRRPAATTSSSGSHLWQAGRHAGHRNGNRIVLGSSCVELIAVVDGDEAASSSLDTWVERRLGEVGEAPVAFCLKRCSSSGRPSPPCSVSSGRRGVR